MSTEVTRQRTRQLCVNLSGLGLEYASAQQTWHCLGKTWQLDMFYGAS